MSDNMNLRHSPDSSRININETHELSYWTKALGCTPEQLKAAVNKVGTSADAVRSFISVNAGTVTDGNITGSNRRG